MASRKTTSMLEASKEFKLGKHSIGYVSDRFQEHFSNTKFEKHSMPTFQKLGRSMSDATIESELKPGFCELGDVLAFLDNAPEECKDGWSNLFYFSSFAVSVAWDGGEWSVYAWDRDDHKWLAGHRVFSPATGSKTLDSGPSGALTLEKAIELVKKEGYRIFKEV